MPTEPGAHPFPHLFVLGEDAILTELEESADNLAVMLIGEGDDDGAADRRVGDETLLNLERINVLTAADDDVLEAAGDGAVAVLIEDGLVSRMEPEKAGGISDHDLVGLLRVIPVARLELVAGDTQFPLLAEGYDVALAIDDLSVSVGHQRPHRREPQVDKIVREGVEARWSRFGETVAACKLRHAEDVDHLLHEGSRHGSSGYDARAEGVAGEALGQFLEERVEHGGHAVEGRAALLGDGLDCSDGVEDLGGVDDLAAVREDG